MANKQFDIWIADLNPRIGTEPGKKRPVLVVQTDLLNQLPHPSTIICPITSNVNIDVDILRVHMKKGTSKLQQDCDIMIDQIRAIDNDRLVMRLGQLPEKLSKEVKDRLKIVLDL